MATLTVISSPSTRPSSGTHAADSHPAGTRKGRGTPRVVEGSGNASRRTSSGIKQLRDQGIVDAPRSGEADAASLMLAVAIATGLVLLVRALWLSMQLVARTLGAAVQLVFGPSRVDEGSATRHSHRRSTAR